MEYPKVYRRNTLTKLLWLYISGLINCIQYANAKENYINK